MRSRRGLLLGAILALAACGDRGSDATTIAHASSIDSALTVAGRRVPPGMFNRYVAQQLGFTSRGGEMRCAYTPLGVEGDRVFLSTLCLEIVRDGDSLAVGSGRGGPVALRVRPDGDSALVVAHEVPGDGNQYAPGIRRIFPPEVAARIFDAARIQTAPLGRLEYYLRGEAASRLGLRP